MQKLIENFKGEIVLPENENYDLLSNSYGGKGTPVAIFRPLDSEDIVSAITFAKKNSYIVSVRSGNHSVAGFGTNKGGIIIDMVNFNKIEIIDKTKNIVKVGTGARWGEVAEYLREYKLGISSGDTKSVGVGGLTLGGGIGWMVRKYGYAIDSLVGAELITASGEILKLSENENSDLFWAIRGGGGNFGVVTNFEFKAHEVKQVVYGNMIYKLENVNQLLRNWRNFMKNADENLTSFFMLMPPFGEGQSHGAMLLFCYVGSKSEAESTLEAFRKFGSVVAENAEEKDYADVLEEAHPPGGVNIIVKNIFAKEFSDELIDQIANNFKNDGNRIIQIRSLTGAPQKIDKNSTALSHRDSEVMMFCGTFLPLDATEEFKNKAMKVWNDIAKFGSGSYANFISTNTPEDVESIYEKFNFEKLLRIKQKFDPENLFSQNYNIWEK